MLNDVNVTVSDGQLGLSSGTGDGVHVKIGVSPVTSDTPIVVKGTYDASKIKALLGLSPLADKVMDSVENGAARILCIPVAASTNGTVGTVDKTGTGTGSCAASGTPYNAYDVTVSITGAGTLNTALFEYTLDDGNSYSDELTVPVNGSYEIPSTGITLQFTAGTGDDAATASFKVGDAYSFETAAPSMTNADVITAIAKLRNISETFELVHVVGESTADLWSAVAAEQLTLQSTYRRPELFVLEAYAPNKEETAAAYAARLVADRKSVKNYNVQVVAARGVYTRMDGTTREINLAGVACGWYAAANPQQSIGETKTFSVSTTKMTALRPAGIEDYIEDLDEAGYLTFRRYYGLDGYFVTNARVLCQDGSDYQYAEDARIVNKIYREVRAEGLQLLQSDVDLEDVDADLSAKAVFMQTPVDTMVRAKEISSGTVIAPSGQDVQTTEKMQVTVRYVSRGKVRSIDVDLGQSKATTAS